MIGVLIKNIFRFDSCLIMRIANFVGRFEEDYFLALEHKQKVIVAIIVHRCILFLLVVPQVYALDTAKRNPPLLLFKIL